MEFFYFGTIGQVLETILLLFKGQIKFYEN